MIINIVKSYSSRTKDKRLPVRVIINLLNQGFLDSGGRSVYGGKKRTGI